MTIKKKPGRDPRGHRPVFTDPSGVRPKQKVLALLRAHPADNDKKAAELAEFRVELAAHIKRFERWFAEKPR